MIPVPEKTISPDPKLKCPEIPELDSYKFPPPINFWKSFPSSPIPSAPTTSVKIHELRILVKSVQHLLTPSQVERAEKLMFELKEGAVIPILKLPGLKDKNTPSVFAHGKVFTDVLASWIKQGFVAGPFISPPLPDFRSNSMMAVEQPGKVRIVMNLSAPKEKSFNDAVNDLALEHVHMATAKNFGYSVIDCGKGCLMWKWDMCDAYKHIPASMPDLRLQGFSWLGKYFLEKQQVFGSSYAPSAFDRLANTVASLALVLTGFPKKQVHRILDDLPFVARADSLAGYQFSDIYRAICERIGVNIAPPCPRQEKAFEATTEGTVMGIRFNTKTLTWALPVTKYTKLATMITDAISGNDMSLEGMQKLMGLLNDFAQMAPFLRAFRFNLNKFLALLLCLETEQKPLPPPAVQELRVWAQAAHTALGGLPIPHRQPYPSLSALTFISDAAGARFTKIDGRFIPYGDQNDRGAASISSPEDGPIWFCARVTWPKFLLLKARDSSDHAYGCKSPTLEAIAMALPLLCCPEYLIGKEILLLTDNEAIVFGWESRKVTNDESASIIIQAMHIISAFLGCWITVRHLPRISTPAARLADRLTRKSTTKPEDLLKINLSVQYQVPSVLLRWLAYPSEDWSLPLRLLDAVKIRLDNLK